MKYPDPRYHGDTGEASATYRPADHAPDLVYPNGTKVHYLATGTLTRGLFGLYRWESPPRAGGPAPHFHRTFTESFYLVAGVIQIYDGRSWIDATPTDFVHVPEGGIHGFRNNSDDWATLLIHFAPGAPRETYMESNARFARDGRPSDEAMADFYREHDNYFVPAPQE
jgi:mannose-6-phosphate isomerase-like protein (cupin superfamily)